MRICDLNVAGIARSNFEPGVNINRRVAIWNYVASVNVVNVGDGIDVAVVALVRMINEKRREPALESGCFVKG